MTCYQQEKAERLRRLRQKVCIEKTTMEAPNWQEGGSRAETGSDPVSPCSGTTTKRQDNTKAG